MGPRQDHPAMIQTDHQGDGDQGTGRGIPQQSERRGVAGLGAAGAPARNRDRDLAGPARRRARAWPISWATVAAAITSTVTSVQK